MTIADRYSAAVHASNLRNGDSTGTTHTDVLGAAAFAAKRTPLGISVMRAMAGDHLEAERLVDAFAEKLKSRAWHDEQVKLPAADAMEMSRSLVAWLRDPACRHCAGHGFLRFEGAPGLSDQECKHCRGAGRRDPQHESASEHQHLIRWLQVVIERESGMASPVIRQALGWAR